MKEISKWGAFSVVAMALCLAVTSCNKNPNQSAAQQQQSTDQTAAQQQSTDQSTAQPQSSDPAQANLASASEQPESQAPAEPSGTAQQAPVQEPAASYQGNDQSVGYDTGDTYDNEQPVEAQQPPPPLPEYSQPECPGPNYIWTPGYWGYASAGYYWVPGAWVLAPYVGSLWTPPYWAFFGGRYRWHRGYWGPHVGFYGGVNYGFGYVGRGYEGGYWQGGAFDYNRSVNNVNTTVIHNVYNYTVTNYTTTKTSYVGGPGGLNARPTAAELAVLHEQRIAPVPAQVQHMQQAATNRAQFAAVNHGRPQTLVAPRPLATAYKAPAPHPTAVPGARTIPPVNARRAATPETRAQAQPNARPGQRVETRPNAMAHAPTTQPRVERRPAPAPAAATHGEEPNVRRANPGQPAARTPQPAPVRPEERPAARTPQASPAHPATHAAQPAPARPEERPATRTQESPHAQPAAHGAPPNRPASEARPAPAQHSTAPPREKKESNDTKR